MYSEELNLKYELKQTPEGSKYLEFEDGVTYNTSEINKLSEIKKKTTDYKEMLSAIHLLKKRLDIVIINVS